MRAVKASLIAALVAVLGVAAYGETAVSNGDGLGLVARTEPLPAVLGYSDVDKSHAGAGGWSQNWYDDINISGAHDPGEPFADSADAGWANPKVAWDSSCWLASACNMLDQLGKVADGDALYQSYCLNGVPSPIGVLTWDDGGLQEYAIQHWMNQNPAQAANMTMNVHWPSQTWIWSDGMFAWDWVSQATSPRAAVDQYLTTGWEVGIGIWPLWYDGEAEYGWHEEGHALTMQSLYANMTFDCTDSNRDWDWIGAGDVNTYTDALRGPGQADDGTWLWGWWNDFYDGLIDYYPAGDVGYVCAITPEPATASLLCIGGMAALVRRRRK